MPASTLTLRLLEAFRALIPTLPIGDSARSTVASTRPADTARILGADCGWLPHRIRQVWVEPQRDGNWRVCCEPWKGPTIQFEFPDGDDRQIQLARILVTELRFKVNDASIAAKWIFESVGHRGASDWFRAAAQANPATSSDLVGKLRPPPAG